ncbi:hypothetical protein ES319_A04G101000v1 [Gossypium barbadense]|uniref:Uncharacterized protein n=2 Tax=Gossypium TaxID=3633 RepID=A0A5J5W624_GOSBA|nr:hypothetical protein ES319_A04G101000v1 [Gossypium barbadense]TYH22268.1 hypothetical protein ES288_A04G113600v1 [Gossypium darwinii]
MIVFLFFSFMLVSRKLVKVKDVLRKYEAASGKVINFLKSGIMFSSNTKKNV